MIDIACERYGRVYRADESHLGKSLKCIECGNIVDITTRTPTGKDEEKENQAIVASRLSPRTFCVAALLVFGAVLGAWLLTRQRIPGADEKTTTEAQRGTTERVEEPKETVVDMSEADVQTKIPNQSLPPGFQLETPKVTKRSHGQFAANDIFDTVTWNQDSKSKGVSNRKRGGSSTETIERSLLAQGVDVATTQEPSNGWRWLISQCENRGRVRCARNLIPRLGIVWPEACNVRGEGDVPGTRDAISAAYNLPSHFRGHYVLIDVSRF